jgi:hypothetical protein
MSLDEAYLDVTENKTGLPTATLVARIIREQIRHELNLTASAGVATNKFLAKIASDWRKPDGLFVIQPDDIDAFLLPLPVGRLPGVGKVTGERLEQLGIKTVGDLRALDLSSLEQQFGRFGERMYELACGVDANEVVPDRLTSLSYLLDWCLVVLPIFIFLTWAIRALSEGQEVCVLGRKYEVLDKPKPVGIQTPAHHSATVLLYEIREIIRIDDSLFDIGCFHNPAFEPTVVDPLLHLVNSDVQSFREAVWGEPISPSLRAFPQTVQHGANRAR